MGKSLLKRDDLNRAKYWFIEAVCASQTYDEQLQRALDQYGNHGPAVSGAGRDHFPHDVKEALRNACKRIKWNSDQAWAAKPPRVHDATLRALSRQVAAKYGCGFYGPQV